MTVSTTTNTIVYRGNGSTTEFPVPFLVFDDVHLIVSRRVYATGVTEETYVGTDYSYSGIGDSEGTLTLSGTALTDTYELVIQRIVPYEQDLDIVNAGGFYPETVEEQLDLIVMQIQQIAAESARSVRAPIGESIDDLGNVSDRAGKFLSWDAEGNPISSTVTGGEDDFRSEAAAASGSSLIGFESDLAGASTRSVQSKLRERVSVKDFGAVGDGVTDDTAAFNLATGAADVFSTDLYREIYVPAGIYVLGGGNTSVRLRKGQTLRGAGMGSTVIDVSSRAANTVPVIIFGEQDNGTDDPGGQAVEACDMTILGGPASYACIDTNSCAGWSVHDIFFSSCGVGIAASGGDGFIQANIFDDGLNGIVITGANLTISDNIFYLMNQQVTFGQGAYNILYDSNRHEFFEVYAILFNTGVTGLKNIDIANCQFFQNEQFAASTGIINNATALSARIRGCSFHNLYGAAIDYGTGLGNSLILEELLFEGLKSLSGYAQSTTMKGIVGDNINIIGNNLTFRNLPGQPITLGGAEATTWRFNNLVFSSCAGGTDEILVSNSNASSSLTLNNIASSRGQTAIVNSQSTVPVFFTQPFFRGAKLRLSANIVAPAFPYITQWSVETYDSDALVDLGSNAGRITIPSGQGIRMVRLTAYIVLSGLTTGVILVQIRDTETGTTDTQVVAGQASPYAFGTQPISLSAVVGDGSTDLGGRWFDVRIYSSDATTDVVSGVYGSYFTLEVIG